MLKKIYGTAEDVKDPAIIDELMKIADYDEIDMDIKRIKNRWQAYENGHADGWIKDKPSLYDKEFSNYKSYEPVGAPKNKYSTGDTARRSDLDPLPKDIRGHNYRPYRKRN